MSIPIMPNLFAVSADDAHVHLAVIALVLRHCTGSVITVTTRHHLDGITLTVADPDPCHRPDQLHGTAFTDASQEPDRSLRVIDHDTIHIW